MGHSSQHDCLPSLDERRNSPLCLGSAQPTNWERVPIAQEGGLHCPAAQNPQGPGARGQGPGARVLNRRAGKKRNPIVFWI